MHSCAVISVLTPTHLPHHLLGYITASAKYSLSSPPPTIQCHLEPLQMRRLCTKSTLQTKIYLQLLKMGDAPECIWVYLLYFIFVQISGRKKRHNILDGHVYWKMINKYAVCDI